jgi:hypothetical protein
MKLGSPALASVKKAVQFNDALPDYQANCRHLLKIKQIE